jgi:autotransporter-associated beta strand protein
MSSQWPAPRRSAPALTVNTGGVFYTADTAISRSPEVYLLSGGRVIRLTKNGGSTQVLSSSNTFTTIQSGTLQLAGCNDVSQVAAQRTLHFGRRFA